MRKLILAAALALGVTACASAPYPGMRPLTQAHIEAMGQTPVVVAQSNFGVTKSWYMTDSSSTGAQYGLIGAIVSATMDAIINAGPSRRARKAANEISELLSTDALDASLVQQIQAQMPAADATPVGVSFSGVTTAQRITAPGPTDDAIEISTSYVLSEDASTLQVTAYVSYQNASLHYTTPYTFKGKVPREETTGPVYRNTFTYYSQQLPTPMLTPELRERLIASIRASYADASGAPPAADSDDFKAMTKELRDAEDNDLTKSEIAIFLTREWLKDNGALLRQEIEGAHAFIARYVALDLNSTSVPSLTGVDELVETMPDQRTVRRVGATTAAGSYISSPGNVAGGYASFGNAIGVADVNMQRMHTLEEEARRARRAAR